MIKENYPRIYLAIDNCVFYKRWTEPHEWSEKIKALGIRYVEASADTEHDPLYSGPEAFERWVSDVRDAEEKYGVKVANLYSGHGTYSTLGLTHPDPSVREHMLTNWFFPMVDTAGKLGCGMGFFAHAFPHKVLQLKEQYEVYIQILESMLDRLGEYAAKSGCREIGLEQMYTPHQYPWRIKDMRCLLKNLKNQGGHDFYFTEDLGHHHIKFMRPSREAFAKTSYPDLWVGSDHAFEVWKEKGADAWDEIEADMDQNPQLFSEAADGNCYTWLSELGCYSPIIHLQQTNGTQSSHLPFTKEIPLTITAIDLFLNSLLGISSNNYYKKDGSLEMPEDEEEVDNNEVGEG